MSTPAWTIVAGLGAAGLAGLLLLLALRPNLALDAAFAAQGRLAGAETRAVIVHGERVVQLEAGPDAAPLIVLLHGFTGAKENWLPLMAKLSRHYRVIAPDLPGWGASSRVAGADYGVLAQARRIADWLDTLPRQPDLLVGHSMGGPIAGLLAADHPSRVPRLALLSSAGVAFAENDFTRAVRAGENPYAVTDRASLDRYLRLVFTDPPFLPWPLDRALIERRKADRAFEHEVLHRLSGPERFALLPRLGDIRAPTLVLWCDDDRVIDVSAAAVLAAGLRDSRTVIFSGCGHMPMYTDPRRTAAELTVLLRHPVPLATPASQKPLGSAPHSR